MKNLIVQERDLPSKRRDVATRSKRWQS